MKLSLGIVGLPNVGKSTLFNALTNNDVPAENYPFCTIDPNVGIVPVMDPRLDKLAELVKPEKTTPAVIEFWDIAGLVKGAAQGEGLGNQFLANIRNVNAIVHVVRAFIDSNVTHVENSIDTKRDIELINTELILKDLETLKAKMGPIDGKAREKAEFRPQLEWFKQLTAHLEAGNLAYNFDRDQKDTKILELRGSLFLLTDKPVLYLVNTTEDNAAEAVSIVKTAVGEGSEVMWLDNKLEFEISQLDANDRAEYLKELGMGEPGLAKLTRACYKLLGLISYFTAGEKEVRAWTINVGTKAPDAAGEIHTDFIKKFIAADVIKYEDFVTAGGWNEAKPLGKVKLQGKDYVMHDGDVVLFRIGA
jgi:ribosome-binding ATPase